MNIDDEPMPQGADAEAEEAADAWQVEEFDEPRSNGLHSFHSCFDQEAADKNSPQLKQYGTMEPAIKYWKDELKCNGVVWAMDVDVSEERSSKNYLVVNTAFTSMPTPLYAPVILVRDKAPAYEAPTYYEIVLEDMPCRTYLDIDLKREWIRATTAAEAIDSDTYKIPDRNCVEKCVINFLLHQLERPLQGVAGSKRIFLAKVFSMEANKYDQAGATTKLSLHVTAILEDADGNEYAWRSADHLKRALSLDEIPEEFKSALYVAAITGEHRLIIDDSMYSRNHQIRTYCSTKINESRPFKNARLYKRVQGDEDAIDKWTFEDLKDNSVEDRKHILALSFAAQTDALLGGIIHVPNDSSKSLPPKKRRYTNTTSSTKAVALPFEMMPPPTTCGLFAQDIVGEKKIYNKQQTMEEWLIIGKAYIDRLLEPLEVGSSSPRTVEAAAADGGRQLVFMACSHDEAGIFQRFFLDKDVQNYRKRVLDCKLDHELLELGHLHVERNLQMAPLNIMNHRSMHERVVFTCICNGLPPPPPSWRYFVDRNMLGVTREQLVVELTNVYQRNIYQAMKYARQHAASTAWAAKFAEVRGHFLSSRKEMEDTLKFECLNDQLINTMAPCVRALFRAKHLCDIIKYPFN